MSRPIKQTVEETLENRKLAVLRGQLQGIVTKLSKYDLARDMVINEP
ncbi:MAG: hypothetical protein MJ224_00015 [archaeon]|nr:hypothetical protein [archaeon]